MKNKVIILIFLVLILVVATIIFFDYLNISSVPPEDNSDNSPFQNFAVIVLPDTQKYVLNSSLSGILTNQTRWIVANKDEMNIKFVIFEGDLVDYASDINQWNRVNSSISLLDGNIAYSVVPGNHDHPLDNFNKFFPVSRFSGGFYKNEADNFQIFDSERDSFIVVSLDFCPKKDEIDWANSVLANYSDRKSILVTHGYLDEKGERKLRECDTDYIFQDLVRKNNNVFLVLSGHVHGESRRFDNNDFGKPVYQILADYQSLENGGNGFLRILEFSGDRIYIKTYSPYLNQYKKENNSEFVLDY
jgi:predicted MPP superfamily phosphohydrolase